MWGWPNGLAVNARGRRGRPFISSLLIDARVLIALARLWLSLLLGARASAPLGPFAFWLPQYRCFFIVRGDDALVPCLGAASVIVAAVLGHHQLCCDFGVAQRFPEPEIGGRCCLCAVPILAGDCLCDLAFCKYARGCRSFFGSATW